MITYYLIGNFMGPFRTKSSTETTEEFIKWADKHNFAPDENGNLRDPKKSGTVVIEDIDSETMKELKKKYQVDRISNGRGFIPTVGIKQ